MSHFVLEPPLPPCGQRYDGAPTEIRSVAGLQQRPWFQRLRRALREQRFVLHYQPIVSLRSGEVSHHEALVRLADEADGSLIAPAHFLPAAERYALVQQIDRLVVSQALQLLAERHSPAPGVVRGRFRRPHSHGQLRIAVNLSALSVTDGGMLSHIQQQLDRHRVDPHQLILEITETAAISNMQRARDFCRAAQSLGCAIALDDFGAGFGSFYYLKHLPFDYLKIDGSFIRGLSTSWKDQLVVKALVDVARGMGKKTIAEFVSDEQTVDLLRGYGVDYAQGFELGRPGRMPDAFALVA